MATVLEGEFRGKASPTHVFLQCLKDAIRERIGGDLRDYPNPEGAAVSTIIICFIHGKLSLGVCINLLLGFMGGGGVEMGVACCSRHLFNDKKRPFL